MRHDKPGNLDWLAFCYIADELSPDDAAAFENQLADDQAAREAVARAVDLTRALAKVGAGDRSRATPASMVLGAWRRRRSAGRLARAVIAAAACLMVVLAYQHYRGIAPVATSPQETADSERIGSSERSARQLAVLWSQTREELAAMQLDDWVVDLHDNLDQSDELLPLPQDAEPDDDAYAANVPPSWMLAAVRAIDRGPGGEDDGNSIPREN